LDNSQHVAFENQWLPLWILMVKTRSWTRDLFFFAIRKIQNSKIHCNLFCRFFF
jgi:hypothetical protein